MKYEQVIGLEVHCELKTKSKMFSSSPVSFAKTPNTMVNEIDFSMPGILIYQKDFKLPNNKDLLEKMDILILL